MNYCKTHPSPDKASHLAVLPCPFGRENASDPLFSGASMLVGHTIDGVNHEGEVSTPFETCFLILTLFPKCCALQNFLRSAIPITLGVRITNHNIKNSGPPSFPKAVRSNISPGFVAQHLTLSPLCRIQFPPIDLVRLIICWARREAWFSDDKNH